MPWNEITSDCSAQNRAIGDISARLFQLPAHTPDVIGCDGFTSRAHANALVISASAISGLFAISVFVLEFVPYALTFVLSFFGM